MAGHKSHQRREKNPTGFLVEEDELEEWRASLAGRGLAPSTVERYLREGRRYRAWTCSGLPHAACGDVLAYRDWLVTVLAPNGVNVAIAAMNSLLVHAEREDCLLTRLRIQEEAYRNQDLEMTRREYESLVRALLRAGDERSALLVQTLASTGIRVSELAFITVESLAAGQAWVRNKGKCRRVLIPGPLAQKLSPFCAVAGLNRGPVFISSSGRPLDRTTVWRILKRASRLAGVPQAKAFPHNLRHLFALCHYERYRDIDAVCVLLGHSRIETTRIYLETTGAQRRAEVDSLGLVLG